MTVRAVKIKGEQVSFLAHNDSAEQLITGTATGETPTGWNFKVKGTYIHWVDDDGAERRKEGTLTGESRTFGSIKVKGETIIFGDEAGNERSVAAITSPATFYPSYDGRIRGASQVDYASAHDAVNGDAVSDTGAAFEVGQYYRHAVTRWWIWRSAVFFDTSALPDDCEISSAVLSLYGGSLGDYSDTDFDITLVSGADLADPLVVADYGDLLDDTTSYGSVTTLGWSTSGYNDITLNSTGRDAINKTGITKFGIRSSRDINSDDPKPDGENGREWVNIYSNDKGGDYRPRLVITY